MDHKEIIDFFDEIGLTLVFEEKPNVTDYQLYLTELRYLHNALMILFAKGLLDPDEFKEAFSLSENLK